MVCTPCGFRVWFHAMSFPLTHNRRKCSGLACGRPFMKTVPTLSFLYTFTNMTQCFSTCSRITIRFSPFPANAACRRGSSICANFGLISMALVATAHCSASTWKAAVAGIAGICLNFLHAGSSTLSSTSLNTQKPSTFKVSKNDKWMPASRTSFTWFPGSWQVQGEFLPSSSPDLKMASQAWAAVIPFPACLQATSISPCKTVSGL